VIFKE